MEHDSADDHGERREQREHQRERGPREPGHGELVGDVGDHRGAHPDNDAPGQPGRMGEGGQGGAEAGRGDGDRGDQHRGAELVDTAEDVAHPGVRDPVAQHDVEHEAGAVAEREHQAKRAGPCLDSGQHRDAADTQGQRRGVAPGPGAERGQDDGTEEFDRPDGSQRQPCDREVEQRVHPGEDAAEREQRDQLPPVEPPCQPPRPPPYREHRRGGGDPQPQHARRRDAREQQHGERGAEVMKDRRDHEEGHRRQARRRSR